MLDGSVPIHTVDWAIMHDDVDRIAVFAYQSTRHFCKPVPTISESPDGDLPAFADLTLKDYEAALTRYIDSHGGYR